MNKKEFIEIEMPNGSKVTAIVIETIADYLLCYAQNRLFLVSSTKYLERIIVEYCIIPEYDQLLLEYYSKTNNI